MGPLKRVWKCWTAYPCPGSLLVGIEGPWHFQAPELPVAEMSVGRLEWGEGLQRERKGCSELTFLDTGSNRCHGIIFKLVRKPKNSLFLLFFSCFSYI